MASKITDLAVQEAAYALSRGDRKSYNEIANAVCSSVYDRASLLSKANSEQAAQQVRN